MKQLKQTSPVLLAFAALIFLFGFIPAQQTGDPGIQGDVFAGATITTTTQSAVVACGQGAGMVGRKTLVVENSSASTSKITVTVELRTSAAAPNFTSGYMATGAGGVATNTLTSTTVTATSAGGRFCQVSATSAGTSVATVTLRRE